MKKRWRKKRRRKEEWWERITRNKEGKRDIKKASNKEGIWKKEKERKEEKCGFEYLKGWRKKGRRKKKKKHDKKYGIKNRKVETKNWVRGKERSCRRK